MDLFVILTEDLLMIRSNKVKMKNLIIVPTYFSMNDKDNVILFDHPTHMDDKGTIETLLSSLNKYKIKTEILILPSPVNRSIERKLSALKKRFPKLNISVYSEKQHKKIVNTAKRFSKRFKEEIAKANYGSVRNLCLIMGAIKKADNIIFLDDDEVIKNKDYIKIAEERVGQVSAGKLIGGKTGYYVDKNNRYLPSSKIPSWKKQWAKEKHLHKFFNSVKSKRRFNIVSNALGGNLVINKKLFSVVPFDPYIQRGEDLDYSLNARLFRFTFLFDNKLVIKHLPPPAPAYWTKLRKDIYRFMYQREKLKTAKFRFDQLDSYPKYFMGKDLERKATITSKKLANFYLKQGDKEAYKECLDNINHISKAKSYAAKNVKKYFTFQKNWVRFIRSL